MLARDNRSAMFVTMLYGDYDPECGIVRIVSAGHNPPLIIRENGVEIIRLPAALPLGAITGTHFEQSEFALNDGETLFLYTDGITEAFNRTIEYGMDRLIERIKMRDWADSKTLAQTVLADIDTFCPSDEQSDDITMLILKNIRSGKSKGVCAMKTEDTIQLTLPADTCILSTVASVAKETSLRIGFAEKEAEHIVLALDEILNNAIMHSYPSGSANTLQIRLIPMENGLRVCVIDYGVPFNFDSAVKRYDGAANIEQPVGGIGLFLVKTLADEFYYEPGTFEGNRVTFVKYFKSDAKL
jgi:sigma-B regulation protein RsbU (phosphoserine phosphatase)